MDLIFYYKIPSIVLKFKLKDVWLTAISWGEISLEARFMFAFHFMHCSLYFHFTATRHVLQLPLAYHVYCCSVLLTKLSTSKLPSSDSPNGFSLPSQTCILSRLLSTVRTGGQVTSSRKELTVLLAYVGTTRLPLKIFRICLPSSHCHILCQDMTTQ